VILDAGVLVSVDRGDLASRHLPVMAVRDRDVLRTSEAVVAQVWREGARQARLARFLQTLEIHPLDDGRNVGHLLRDSGTSDVVDAHVALLAQRLGDEIVTGDVDDLARLVESFDHEPPAVIPWPPR
jgi:hypothetical protein